MLVKGRLTMGRFSLSLAIASHVFMNIKRASSSSLYDLALLFLASGKVQQNKLSRNLGFAAAVNGRLDCHILFDRSSVGHTGKGRRCVAGRSPGVAP